MHTRWPAPVCRVQTRWVTPSSRTLGAIATIWERQRAAYAALSLPIPAPVTPICWRGPLGPRSGGGWPPPRQRAADPVCPAPPRHGRLGPRTRASGGTADALASGASVRKDVGVQIPPCALSIGMFPNVGVISSRKSSVRAIWPGTSSLLAVRACGTGGPCRPRPVLESLKRRRGLIEPARERVRGSGEPVPGNRAAGCCTTEVAHEMAEGLRGADSGDLGELVEWHEVAHVV